MLRWSMTFVTIQFLILNEITIVMEWESMMMDVVRHYLDGLILTRAMLGLLCRMMVQFFITRLCRSISA